MIKKYFLYDIYFSLFAIVLAGTVGYFDGGMWTAVCNTLTLAVLEVSLSFDNAVVNATILEDMDEKWRKRFLTWGIIIAVFGMRIIFPLVIIMFAGNIGFIDACKLAITDHKKYAEILSSAHVAIAGFGGSFLLLVALEFFFNKEKENHWIKFIENPINKLSGMIEGNIEVGIALLIVVVFGYMLPHHESMTFIMSGIFGILLHIVVKVLGSILNYKSSTLMLAKSGIASFIYLEVLDASFSFDGVVGALVITNNILIIALGLGIGAFFVRSLTIMAVDKKKIAEYKYMENGAFYAIISLAIIMFVSVIHEVPNYITALLSVSLIGFAIIHSIYENKKES